MGEVSLESVGAAAPEVHVESTVLLAGVGVVVFERCVALLTQLEIELGQEGVRVVGPADGAEISLQGSAERGVHEGEQGRVDRSQAVSLLGLIVHLLIVSQEEEHLVPGYGAAERGAELVLLKIRREAGCAAGGKGVAEVGRERVV